jgi:hypothetical protein
MFTVGRTAEISRDEVKFQKFVNKLRKKFSYLFIDILRVQLLLKGIITDEDWEDFREVLAIDFIEDNYFSQLKEFEILRERVTMADSMTAYIGKFYSETWMRHNIFGQSDEDIERMDKEIAEEAKKMAATGETPLGAEPDDGDSGGGSATKPKAPEKPSAPGKPGETPPKKKKAPSDGGLADAEKAAMKSI